MLSIPNEIGSYSETKDVQPQVYGIEPFPFLFQNLVRNSLDWWFGALDGLRDFKALAYSPITPQTTSIMDVVAERLQLRPLPLSSPEEIEELFEKSKREVF